MKRLKLSPEEKQLEREIAAGEWKTVPNWPKRKKELEAAARAHLAKSARVNIRLAPGDLQGLKIQAGAVRTCSSVYS